MKILIGFLVGALIIFLEYNFACWIQGSVNALIPHGEYYGIIHLATLFAHIFILGGIYVWLFVVSLGIIGFSLSSK